MTKKATSDRGSYRGIYETLYDDLEFQRLTPLAKLVWHILKAKLTQYGIAVFYPETLPRLVGMNAAMIEVALTELERHKPGQNLGWLVREEHVFWLVNGFRFDPAVGGPNLTENHKTGARRYAETLPKLDVVRQFLSYYGLTATAPKPAPTIGRDSPTHPPSPTLSHRDDTNRVGGNRESERERETESESEMGSPTPIPGLSPAVARFVARFYDNAPEERRQEVIGQLRATIATGPGARVKKGVHAKARDLAHLDRCCREVVEDPPKDANVAIYWVLTKLNDPILDARGLTVTEAASQRAKDDARLFDLYHAQRTAAGRTWARENPEAWKEIEERVDRTLPSSDMPMYQTIRQTQLADAAGKAAGFPEYEEWLASREVTAA